jgi:hypothetical protein
MNTRMLSTYSKASLKGDLKVNGKKYDGGGAHVITRMQRRKTQACWRK